jgi:predicted RNA-binding Zn-ribbon protein involved in translation (DUF1610 family)
MIEEKEFEREMEIVQIEGWKCTYSFEELEKQFNKYKRCPHCGEKIYRHESTEVYPEDSVCESTWRSTLVFFSFLMLF